MPACAKTGTLLVSWYVHVSDNCRRTTERYEFEMFTFLALFRETLASSLCWSEVKMWSVCCPIIYLCGR